MTKSNPPAGNRGARVDTGSAGTAMLPRLILVAGDAPADDAAWLTDLLVGAA